MSDPNGWDSVGKTAAAERSEGFEPEQATFTLVVEDGADRGQRLVIDPSEPLPVHVGQSRTCALRLNDAEVSRRHAAFDVVDGRLKITDLDSTNGTWIGEVRVFEISVEANARIRVGKTVLRVDAGAACASREKSAARFGRFLGGSPEIRRLYPLCARFAASDIPVIIEGETGTGKEVLAEALHELGPRASGPFVVFDCTAVSASLMEAELFGHERGAFTGATAPRTGYFEQAHGGTLLIDEIGDLELGLQAKFLRALDRKEIRRLGSDRAIQVDVRILAATRRNIDKLVQDGRFRDDLYHRLAIGRIELPPLRRRRGDILLLAREFWKELGGDPAALTADVVARWEEETWPGNVRELRNRIARKIALGDLASAPTTVEARHAEGGPDDFMADVIASKAPLPVARTKVIEEFERRYVESFLEHHGGNVSRAAQSASVTRRHFQKVRARTRR